MGMEGVAGEGGGDGRVAGEGGGDGGVAGEGGGDGEVAGIGGWGWREWQGRGGWGWREWQGRGVWRIGFMNSLSPLLCSSLSVPWPIPQCTDNGYSASPGARYHNVTGSPLGGRVLHTEPAILDCMEQVHLPYNIWLPCCNTAHL